MKLRRNLLNLTLSMLCLLVAGTNAAYAQHGGEVGEEKTPARWISQAGAGKPAPRRLFGSRSATDDALIKGCPSARGEPG